MNREQIIKTVLDATMAKNMEAVDNALADVFIGGVAAGESIEKYIRDEQWKAAIQSEKEEWERESADPNSVVLITRALDSVLNRLEGK